MKNIEIKKVDPKSAFKVTLYYAIIPMALMFLIGVLVLIIGLVTSTTEMTIIGLPYMVMPIFMLAFYGLIGFLTSLVYNGLAKKFGGLELTIEETETPIYQQNQYTTSQVTPQSYSSSQNPNE